jgi:hypothetical protein
LLHRVQASNVTNTSGFWGLVILRANDDD